MIRAFKMRLEYGMGPEFEKRHAEVWPEVERSIHEYGGSDCSVFLDERQGVLFGVIMARLISTVMGTPTAVSVGATLIALGFSTVIGVLFGLLPAVKAANLNPIEALRRD